MVLLYLPYKNQKENDSKLCNVALDLVLYMCNYAL